MENLAKPHPRRGDAVMPFAVDPAAPARVDRIRAVTAGWDHVTVAPVSALPPVLADPPWRNRRKTAKPAGVAGLACTDPATLTWLPGEEQTWARTRELFQAAPSTDWTPALNALDDGTRSSHRIGRLFIAAPPEIARPAFDRWRPRPGYSTPTWLKGVTTRFGVAVLPAILTLARTVPADYGPLLLPFTAPEVAQLMADWTVRLKTMRPLAQQWLLRHAPEAARALIPAALGRSAAARRALFLLRDNGQAEQIHTEASRYGPAATAAVQALLTTDPLTVLPTRMPTPPVWAAPGVLPPVRLRDGSGTLPPTAVADLVLMLMISRFDEPYAGLDSVRDAVETADLAGLGWTLFELWQSTGGYAKDSWVFDAVAVTGDDDTARRIAPILTAWPSEGLTARAVTGLSVLVGIGSGEALAQLHRISQRAKSAPLRKAAAGRITDIADRLGLTAEQLADRIVPDLGLDADGSLRLDYGPRQFVIGFDEQLRPFVTDTAGARLKTLPKPGVRDDEELSQAAGRQFATLKREVRKIAAEQVRRLERAMVDGRQWTGAEFRRLFVDHPLMWHIARRLVWAGAGAGAAGALRIAEDRSFADIDDNPVVLADDEPIGVAHPVRLGPDTSRWATVFTDYEILQPFPQLDRPVFTLAAGQGLDRFTGVTVPAKKILVLDGRGWIRHEPANAGIQHGFDRPTGDGRVLTVRIEPGLVGKVGFHHRQKLAAIHLHDGSVSPWSLDEAEPLPADTLDPVTVSEILRDLTDVTT